MHPVRTNAMPDPQDPAVTPAEVAAWLARVRAGRTGVPSPATHWNLWLGLRFLLRLRAEPDPDRAWALLVLAVDAHMGRHQRLAEVPLGEVAHDSMMFRVGLLRRLGAVPGDELLDPAVVLDWARAVLTHPLDEMLAMAASCRRRMGTTVRLRGRARPGQGPAPAALDQEPPPGRRGPGRHRPRRAGPGAARLARAPRRAAVTGSRPQTPARPGAPARACRHPIDACLAAPTTPPGAKRRRPGPPGSAPICPGAWR
jgi:hypothetical protein